MTEGELIWAAIGVAAFAWWLVRLVAHPYAPCWACRGSRRNPGSTAKAYGRCLVCGGSGERRRFGAALVHPSAKRRK